MHRSAVRGWQAGGRCAVGLVYTFIFSPREEGEFDDAELTGFDDLDLAPSSPMKD